MKQITLLLMAMVVFSFPVCAEHDVTRFFDIPVDGTKAEVLQKLKDMGFTSTPSYPDVLTGRLNGHEVNIFVKTSNNKVYRIMAADANTEKKHDIRIRYNELIRKFANDPAYEADEHNAEIMKDEDIINDIPTRSKHYKAVFYQKPDTALYKKDLETFLLSQNYTKEQIDNPTEEMNVLMKEHFNTHSRQKAVWFMISSFRNEYYISLYYDNAYNDERQTR